MSRATKLVLIAAALLNSAASLRPSFFRETALSARLREANVDLQGDVIQYFSAGLFLNMGIALMLISLGFLLWKQLKYGLGFMILNSLVSMGGVIIFIVAHLS